MLRFAEQLRILEASVTAAADLAAFASYRESGDVCATPPLALARNYAEFFVQSPAHFELVRADLMSYFGLTDPKLLEPALTATVEQALDVMRRHVADASATEVGAQSHPQLFASHLFRDVPFFIFEDRYDSE
jgi:hypothetical protein